jgi:uncharacterized protein YajQ (UPF0234 family)
MPQQKRRDRALPVWYDRSLPCSGPCRPLTVGTDDRSLLVEEGSMAGASSFDIVSKFDRQELKNAVDQAQREMQTRYDLKDTKSELALDEKAVTLTAPSEYVLTTIRDMLDSKAIRRGLSLKVFDAGKVEEISGGRVRQVITLREGLADDLAKKMAKTIRDEFKKVTPQIQGDAIRVQGKNKDDLQDVIQYFRQHEEDYPVALQFVNYR